jgi:hypothetical protein
MSPKNLLHSPCTYGQGYQNLCDKHCCHILSKRMRCDEQFWHDKDWVVPPEVVIYNVFSIARKETLM